MVLNLSTVTIPGLPPLSLRTHFRSATMISGAVSFFAPASFSGQCRGRVKDLVWHLPFLCEDDHVGSREIPGMEPKIVGAGGFEGHLLVIGGTLPNQDGEPVYRVSAPRSAVGCV